MLLSNKPSLLALTAALLLSGCTLGPDFAAPAAPGVQSYAMKGDAAPKSIKLTAAAAAGPWWTALASPALDTTIKLALAGSPTLDEADATLAQSRALLGAAQGQALPQVSLSAGAARERANLQAAGFSSFGGISISNPTFPLYSLGGAVSYDLDLFGGQKRRIESAAAQAEAQAWRSEAAYLALTANVALQAVTVATLRAQIAALESIIADDQKTVDLVTRAADLGGMTRAATLSAQTQLEVDRAQLPALQGQLSAARHALALLAGRAPAAWSPPDFDMADFAVNTAVPLELPSTLVRKRPDILAAEADLHAATAEIGVATANLYPDIKLTASLTQGAQMLDNIFSYDSSAWSLAAGLTAPLFDGGTLEAQQQAAVAAAQAADARYRQTVLKAFVEVADALQAIATDDATIAEHKRTEAQSAESLRLARVGLQEGGGTLLDVLDAQRAHSDAVAARIRAEGQRLADIVRLFAATGADWRVAGVRPQGA